MKKSALHTLGAPKVVGPYSQAIISGEMIFLSGQIGLNPKTGEMAGKDIVKQTKQVMENLASVLKEAGTDFSSVVKTTIYLQNMDHYSQMNDTYASFLKEPYPARATVQVARLPREALVEIEMIAVASKEKECDGDCQCEC